MAAAAAAKAATIKAAEEAAKASEAGAGARVLQGLAAEGAVCNEPRQALRPAVARAAKHGPQRLEFEPAAVLAPRPAMECM